MGRIVDRATDYLSGYNAGGPDQDPHPDNDNYVEIREPPKKRFKRGRHRTEGYYGRYNRQVCCVGQAENKFFDSVFVPTAIAAAGTVFTSINLVPQGTTESTRIGRKINISSIQIHLTIEAVETTDATQTDNIIRFMLVLDRQCNGSNPVWADVFETADIFTFHNLAKDMRFVILIDEVIDMNHQIGAGNGTANDFPAHKEMRHYVLNGNWPIEFDSTVGAITEIQSYNFMMMAVKTATTSVVNLEGRTRIRYSG